MATIPVVSDGDDILASWAADVAEALNEIQKLRLFMLASNEATNAGSGSAVDITGAGFPVVAGRKYIFHVVGQYQVSATNQGPGLGCRHPGGTVIQVWRIFGATSASAEVIERITTSSANTDSMTAAASANAGATTYHFEATIAYVCTADGTLQFRKQRNGTSGSTGVTLVAPMSIICHQSAI